MPRRLTVDSLATGPRAETPTSCRWLDWSLVKSTTADKPRQSSCTTRENTANLTYHPAPTPPRGRTWAPLCRPVGAWCSVPGARRLGSLCITKRSPRPCSGPAYGRFGRLLGRCVRPDITQWGQVDRAPPRDRNADKVQVSALQRQKPGADARSVSPPWPGNAGKVQVRVAVRVGRKSSDGSGQEQGCAFFLNGEATPAKLGPQPVASRRPWGLTPVSSISFFR